MTQRIEVDADDYANLCAQNIRLRNKLLELAAECAECGGTGAITVTDDMQDAFGKVLPCPQCEDIREALA